MIIFSVRFVNCLACVLYVLLRRHRIVGSKCYMGLGAW